MGSLPTLVATILLALTNSSHGLRTQRESNAFMSPERTQAIAVCRGQAVTINIWPDVTSVAELIGNFRDNHSNRSHRGQCAYVISPNDLGRPFVSFTYSRQGLQLEMISPTVTFGDKFPWLLTLYINIEDSNEVVCTVMNGTSQVWKTIFKFSATEMKSPLFLSTQITMKTTLRNSVMGVECTVTPPVFPGYPPVLLALRGPYGEVIASGKPPTLSSSLPDGYLAGRYSCGLEGQALACLSPPLEASQRTTSLRIESILPKPLIDHPAFLTGREHGRLNCSVLLNQFAAADLGSSHPLVWAIGGVSQNAPGRIREWRLIPEGRVGVLHYVSELYLGITDAHHAEQNITCTVTVGQQTAVSFWVAHVVFPPLMPTIVGPDSVLRGDVSQFKCITEGASLVSPTVTWSDNTGRHLQKMTRTSFVTYHDDISQGKSSQFGQRKRKSARGADHQEMGRRSQLLWSDWLSVFAENGVFLESGNGTAQLSLDRGTENRKRLTTGRPSGGRNNLNNGARSASMFLLSDLQTVPDDLANTQLNVPALDKITQVLHTFPKKSEKRVRSYLRKTETQKEVQSQNTRRKRAVSETHTHGSSKAVFDESTPGRTDGVKDRTFFILNKTESVNSPASTNSKPKEKDEREVGDLKQVNSRERDVANEAEEDKLEDEYRFKRNVKRGDPKPKKEAGVMISNTDTLHSASISNTDALTSASIPEFRNDSSGHSQEEKAGDFSGGFSDASGVFAELLRKENELKKLESKLSENKVQGGGTTNMVEDLQFSGKSNDTNHTVTTMYRVVSVIEFLPPPEVQEVELQCIVHHVSLSEKLIASKNIYVADPPYKPVIRGPHEVLPGEKASWTCHTEGPSTSPPSLRWSDDQAHDLTSLSSTSSATYDGVDGRTWHSVTSVLTYSPAQHAHIVKLQCTVTFAIISVSVSGVSTISVKGNLSPSADRTQPSQTEGLASRERAASQVLSRRVVSANASESQLEENEGRLAASPVRLEPHPDKHGYMGSRYPGNALDNADDRQEPEGQSETSRQASGTAEESYQRRTFMDLVSIHSPDPRDDHHYFNRSSYEVFESMDADEKGFSSEGQSTAGDAQSSGDQVSADGDSGVESRPEETRWHAVGKNILTYGLSENRTSSNTTTLPAEEAAPSGWSGHRAFQQGGRLGEVRDSPGKTSENMTGRDMKTSSIPGSGGPSDPAASYYPNDDSFGNITSENSAQNAHKSNISLGLDDQRKPSAFPGNKTSSAAGGAAAWLGKTRKRVQFRGSPSGVRINPGAPDQLLSAANQTYTDPRNATLSSAPLDPTTNLTEWQRNQEDLADRLTPLGALDNLTAGGKELSAESQDYESPKPSEGVSARDKMMFAVGFASVFVALVLVGIFILWYHVRGRSNPTDGY